MRWNKFFRRRVPGEFARTCHHESFLCACCDGVGRGKGWDLDTFSLFLKLNTSWRSMVVFRPRPLYPLKKESSVLFGQEFALTLQPVWTFWRREAILAAAGGRTKILLTSCPQCIHYTHYSLPALYRGISCQVSVCFDA